MKKVNCFGELSVGSSVWLREIYSEEKMISTKRKIEKVSDYEWDDSKVDFKLDNGMYFSQMPKELRLVACNSVVNDSKTNSFFISVNKLS